MSASDEQTDTDGGWMDMSRYPNLDPDHALPVGTLAALHDILHTWNPAPLPTDTWTQALDQATNPAAHLDTSSSTAHQQHDQPPSHATSTQPSQQEHDSHHPPPPEPAEFRHDPQHWPGSPQPQPQHPHEQQPHGYPPSDPHPGGFDSHGGHG